MSGLFATAGASLAGDRYVGNSRVKFPRPDLLDRTKAEPEDPHPMSVAKVTSPDLPDVGIGESRRRAFPSASAARNRNLGEMSPRSARSSVLHGHRADTEHPAPMGVGLRTGADGPDVGLGENSPRVDLSPGVSRGSVDDSILPVFLRGSDQQMMRVHASRIAAQVTGLHPLWRQSTTRQDQHHLVHSQFASLVDEVPVPGLVCPVGSDDALARLGDGSDRAQPGERFTLRSAAREHVTVAVPPVVVTGAHALLGNGGLASVDLAGLKLRRFSLRAVVVVTAHSVRDVSRVAARFLAGSAHRGLPSVQINMVGA